MIDMSWIDRKQRFAKPVPDRRPSWANTDLLDKQWVLTRLLLPSRKALRNSCVPKKEQSMPVSLLAGEIGL